MDTHRIMCQTCGGDLLIDESGLKGKCPYCGNVWELKKPLDNASFVKLQTAMEYQKTFHFANALRLYQELAQSNPDLLEAWWGAFLSEYGIEFGRDRYGRSVPTCHRTHTESVYKNLYYQKALQLSTGETREIYADLGERIENIRAEIIKKVEDGKNYDIFICFKATEVGDETRRTIDYELGKTLYDEFTQKGYSVFFSSETLNRIRENEYEPYIYKALTTARVMLLLCSDIKEIESPWVKNEWSRYIDLHGGKGLIPICGNRLEPFRPSELPMELQRYNAILFDEKILYNVNNKVEAYFPEKSKEQNKQENDNAITSQTMEQLKRDILKQIKQEELKKELLNQIKKSAKPATPPAPTQTVSPALTSAIAPTTTSSNTYSANTYTKGAALRRFLPILIINLHLLGATIGIAFAFSEWHVALSYICGFSAGLALIISTIVQSKKVFDGEFSGWFIVRNILYFVGGILLTVIIGLIMKHWATIFGVIVVIAIIVGIIKGKS